MQRYFRAMPVLLVFLFKNTAFSHGHRNMNSSVSNSANTIFTPEIKLSKHNLVLCDTVPNVRKQSIDTIRVAQDTLKGVTIKGKRIFLKQSVDRTTILVENNDAFKGSNLEEVLEKIPGVVIDANNRVQIYGSSSVKFQINGRDVPVSSSTVSTLLKSIQSSSIKSLEIINPSAKTDAQGASQILNINTLQPATEGFTVNPGFTYSQGKYPRAGINLFAQLKIKKLSFQYLSFIDYSDEYSTDVSARQYKTNSILTNVSQQLNKKRSYLNNIDLGYEISKSDKIGFSFHSFVNNQKGAIDNKFRRVTENIIDSTINNNSLENVKFAYNIYTAYYSHSFKNAKQVLLFNVDFNHANNSQGNIYQSEFYQNTEQGLPVLQTITSLNNSKVNIPSAYLNYSHPVFKTAGLLELGVKYISTRDREFYTFQNVQPGQYFYSENVKSGYFSLLYDKKDISFQAGLRGENTESQGEVNNQITNPRNYFNLFPSISLQKKFDNDNVVLTVRYNKRIRRPSFLSLSPFLFYTSPYDASKGDPQLNPTFIDDYSSSINYKNLYLTGGLVKIKNQITTLPIINDDLSILVNQYYNIGSQIIRSFSLSYPFNIKKVSFSPSINADFGTSRFLINSIQTVKNTDNLSFNLSGVYKYSKTGRFEIRTFYLPKVETIYSKINHKSAVTVRYIKSFFNGSLSGRAAVEDIFNNNRESGTNNFGGYIGTFSSFYDNRRFSLSLTYSLRKGKRVQVSTNTEGNEDNNNRIKGQ